MGPSVSGIRVPGVMRGQLAPATTTKARGSGCSCFVYSSSFHSQAGGTPQRRAKKAAVPCHIASRIVRAWRR
jgi:hypothetical protein